MSTKQQPIDDADELIDENDPNAVDQNAVDPADLEDDGSTLDTPEELATKEAARVQALPLTDPAAAPVAQVPGAPTAPEPGKTESGVMIPKTRFDEVSQRNKDLQAEKETLLAAMAAMGKTPAPPAAAPEPPPFDMKAAQKEQLAALAAGDDDKALDLAEKINAHLLATATANAVAAMRKEQETMTAEQQKADLATAVADVVLLYPQLDSQSDQRNGDAVIFCRGKRDELIAAGESWGKALRMASESTAKLFGFTSTAAPPPPAPAPAPTDPKLLKPDLRLVQARARNAAAAAAQPPDTNNGIGNRAATAPLKFDPRNMTDDELNRLPPAELAKLDGSA